MLSVNETEKSIFNRGNNVHMQMDKKSMAGRLGTANFLPQLEYRMYFQLGGVWGKGGG